MNSIRSIASQCKSVSSFSSPAPPISPPPTLPCALTLLSLAPNDEFKCAILLNRLRRNLMAGYSLPPRSLGDGCGGGVRIGLDIRRESKLRCGFRGRCGGERGDKEDSGTGVWNHARSGFVRRTSLSICSRISLSWKKVLHLDVVDEFNGYIIRGR